MPYSNKQISDGARQLESAGASEREIEEFVSNAKREQVSKPSRNAESELEAMAGGGLMLSPKAFNKMAIPAIRYGAPLAAGMAVGAALPTAAIGTTAGLLAAGGVAAASGGAGFVGDVMGQVGEIGLGKRKLEDFSFRQAAGEGVANLAPFFTKGKALAKAGVSAFAKGEVLLRAGLNSAGSVGAYLAGNKTKGEDTDKLGYGLSGGVPLALQSLGTVGRYINKARTAAESIASQRLSQLSVLLGEVAPGWKKTEGRMAAKGNELVNRITNNMDTGLATHIDDAFPEVDFSGVANELSQMTGKLEPLRIAATNARDAVIAAEAGMNKTLLTVKADSRAIVGKAHEKALEKVRQKAVTETAIFRDAVEKEFGSADLDLSGITQGQRMKNAQSMVSVSDKAAKSRLTAMYEEAGVGLNDTVATARDMKGFVTYSSRKGKPLEGVDARARVKSLIDKAMKTRQVRGADGKLVDEKYLTLERMMALKSEIAKELKDELPDVASRVANDAFSIVKKGVNKYMGRNNLPQSQAWNTAQGMAARNFNTRSTNAMEHLRAGDSEKFLNAVKTEGKQGFAMKEVEDYAATIAAAGDPAAAQAFLSDTNRLIRDGVLDRAINRGSGRVAVESINPDTLARELSELSSSKFDISKLGLGTKEQVNGLAQMAAKRGEGGYSMDEVANFLEAAEAVGIPAAQARLTYAREVIREAVSGGLNDKGRVAKKLRQTQIDAKMTAQEANAAMVAAENNPIVAFLGGTTMKLSPDNVNNAKWIDQLFGMDTKTLDGFFGALEASSRKGDIQLIRQATSTRVMRGLIDIDPNQAVRLDTSAAHQFFLGGGEAGAAKRRAVKSILGPEEYKNLHDNFGTPIASVHATKFNLSESSGRSTVEGALGSARGKLGGVGPTQYYGNGLAILDWIREYGYVKAYNVLVNPAYAGRYKAAGNTLEQFISSQPTNALLVKLWTQQDEKNTKQSGK